MSDPGFGCDSCGRRFKWKAALAGRVVKCRCGEVITIPDREPAGALELAELPDDSGAGPVTLSTNGKCVNCNAPLKGSGVVCVGCGTDQRTGKKLGTHVAAGADALDEPDLRSAGVVGAVSGTIRRNDGPDGGRDAYRAGGMVALEFGLWCELLSILLAVLSVIGLVVAIFVMDEEQAELLLNLTTIAGAVLSVLAYGLMLAVPGEAKARGVLIVALVLIISEIGLSVMVEEGTLLSVVASFLGFLSTVFFLYFLKQLAGFFAFAQVEEDADKVLGLFVLLSIGQFIFYLPAFGFFYLFIVVMYIGMAIYTFFLYVRLLFDLLNSARYRRHHGGPIEGMIR